MFKHSFEAEYQVAKHLALKAGRAVMRFYGRAVDEGDDPSAPVTEADRESNRIILAGLKKHFPDDEVLSEEAPDSPDRLAADRVWLVDPVDGTKEFLSGNGEFSVMIGLAVAATPVIGIVYLPAREVLYAAAWGAGAWIEQGNEVRPLRAARPSEEGLRLISSRSHLSPVLNHMAEELGISDRRQSGSVGIKCALIAEGVADLYIHPVPYLKEWDCCAPDLILREAGGTVTDCYGEPLRYNKRMVTQPHGFLGCAPGVLEEVLPTVARIFASDNETGKGPATTTFFQRYHETSYREQHPLAPRPHEP